MKSRHRNDGLRKVCGCPRRRWSACEHPWHFNFKWNGTHYRLSLDRHLGRRITSKTEARDEADQIRLAIKAGAFHDRSHSASDPVSHQLTFGDVAGRYLKEYVRVPQRRASAVKTMEYHMAVLRRTEIPAANGQTIRLESKPFEAITRADIKAVREARRVIMREAAERLQALDAQPAATDEKAPRVRPGIKSGEIGINRLLARWRHLCSWAVLEGLIPESPFRIKGQAAVALNMTAETARDRRLQPGEEEALLMAASSHLRALIVAALSTGCRVGELLGLQWRQVQRDEQGQARWLQLSADRTKTGKARTIPIGPRLRAELEMRRTDPAGQEHKPDAYVFGDEIGGLVGSIKTAWRATCRRANITGLHFHDLRREFGSRVLESGAAMHDVREFLGHANITTTSRYLASTPLRLERVLAEMEEAAARCKKVANDANQTPPQTPKADTVSATETVN